jgi:hypothetical protein
MFFLACHKQGSITPADPTPIDGIYKGFYFALDSTRQVATEIEFDRGKYKFKHFIPLNLKTCEGSFSISDSTLSISQTRDEICACSCCQPNVDCLFNPFLHQPTITFKIIGNQLTLIRTSLDTSFPTVFTLKKE